MKYERLIRCQIGEPWASLLDEHIGKRAAVDVTIHLHREPDGSHVLSLFVPYDRVERDYRELSV